MDEGEWIALRPGDDIAAQLLAASRRRRGLACAGARVDAADVRAACLAAADADPFGLRLADARITGPLDLSACQVPVPLRFQACTFTAPINIQGARLHDLVIIGDPLARSPQVLPGLLGTGSRIARDLNLSGMTITGDLPGRSESRASASVWLTEAEIGGSLVANGARILPAAGRALHADRIQVAGNIRFRDGFHTTGEIRLLAMRLSGSLDVIGAELEPTDGRALELSESIIGGSMYILNSPITGHRCRVRGRVDMAHSTVKGLVFIRDADLTLPPAGSSRHFYSTASRTERILLLAPRLNVHGSLRIEGDTVVRGGVLLRGATLGGGVKLDGVIWNPADIALDLAQATLGGGLEGSELSVEGSVLLDSARIDGAVALDRATLTKPLESRCLSAVNLTVTGDVHLRGLTVLHGKVNFRGASIAGVFNAEDVYVTNVGDATLSLHMAQVTGNVRMCGRFRSVGTIILNRAIIGGRLRADGATLTGSAISASPDSNGRPGRGPVAIDATSAVIRGGMDLGWRVTSGSVDLTGVSTSYLADRPDQDWPADSYLGGFAYERFEAVDRRGDAVWDVRTRIAWLARMRRYDQRAWEHLAAVFRAAGDRDGADDVLVAQRRQARGMRTAPRRLLDVIQDVTVRYGFRPQRALYLLLALIAAVTIGLSLPGVQAQMRATDQNALVFTPAGARPLPGELDPPGECGNGKVRCLSPFFYAVDTVVPLIDLHQRSTWYPAGEHGSTLLGWLLNLCTILGWAASTVFAVSFTRLGRAG